MTFAQFVGSGTTGIVGAINTIVVPLIFAFAFVVFLWGVLKYFFFSINNESEREKGRGFVLYGIIGMVVLVSVWGLVNILLSTLGFAP